MMSREQLIATYKKRRDDHNKMEEKLRESKLSSNSFLERFGLLSLKDKVAEEEVWISDLRNKSKPCRVWDRS